MKEIKAVYFDFDGVATIDPNGSTTTFKAIYEMEDVEAKTGMSFEQFYGAYSDEDGKQRFMHPLEKGEVCHAEVWDTLCKKIGYDIPFKLLDTAFRTTEMNLEILYVAQKLLDAGHVVGMITDNPLDRMEAIADEQGLYGLFNPMIVSADSEVGTLKKQTDTKNFAVASYRSGVPLENSVFIDNSGGNVEAARNQGMEAIKFDDSVLRNPLARRREVARIEEMLKRYHLSF